MKNKETFMNNYIFTSESVSDGHPDKVADQISDAPVDAFGLRMRRDNSRAHRNTCNYQSCNIGGRSENFNVSR